MQANELDIEIVKKHLRFDQATGQLFWRTGTSIRKRGEAGYINAKGYRVVMLGGKNVRAHRIVWALVHGEWPSIDIDHINGDRGDNQPSNLRLATRSQNNQNQRAPRSNSKSPYLGVTWHGQSKRWAARITVNRKVRHLGLFKTPEEASQAYVAAKREIHSHGML
ncbi:MAG: HNH endonuclease [Polaromonas sp.]|nr:HNH endonuclease [Polaromonas sp.]